MLQIILMAELKVEALQVKYPLIDWEIYSEGSRTYWKIIRVGGIIQAYQSFEDMLKDFDREYLDALDEEPAKKIGVEETLLQESFKKLRAEVKASGSHTTQDTPTVNPTELSEEYVQNMLQIILMAELKVEALQVKYPLIDWEIYSEGSRTYWKIIRVGGIIQAYQSFEDMLKDFDREYLDAL
nr:hypothetical protein [Tanacetum cinerariifolium]